MFENSPPCDTAMMTLTHLFPQLADDHLIGWHQNQPIRDEQLRADVAALSGQLALHPAHRWAVFHTHAYPTLVALLALWQTGRGAWLPGNNLPATETALANHCQGLLGEWQTPTALPNGNRYALDVTRPEAELVIFTSGSSGEPKAIHKQYRQLLNELDTLEQAFGHRLTTDTVFAGTVSHQHIYGLLFRLLWPLASGRPLVSERLQDPLSLLTRAQSQPTVWVASPAHLKRLRHDLPWHNTPPLQAIFSSGGPLPRDIALQMAQQHGQPVTEVYGSSETGGIAWRVQQPESDSWTPLPGIRLQAEPGGTTLCSPHLLDDQPCSLDDQIDAEPDGRFRLGPRKDSIVKIEGKRLSLNTLRSTLNSAEWVAESEVIALPDQRLGAIVVLTPAGSRVLAEQGRRTLSLTLRAHLAPHVDAVGLPRRWRFVTRLPETAQGKRPLAQLHALFSNSQTLLPTPTQQEHTGNTVALTLPIAHDLPWFSGHFAQQGVLPGVVQIDWAEGFGRQHFSLPSTLSHLEVIKFNNLITPGNPVQLKLEWKPDSGKLLFAFRGLDDDRPHSSGRLVFHQGTPS